MLGYCDCRTLGKGGCCELCWVSMFVGTLGNRECFELFCVIAIVGTLDNRGPSELCCVSMIVAHSSLEDAVNCLR